MKKLKLYVWHDVLTDYTSGIMFALASNVDEARKMIIEENDFDIVKLELKKQPKIYSVPVGFAVWGGG